LLNGYRFLDEPKKGIDVILERPKFSHDARNKRVVAVYRVDIVAAAFSRSPRALKRDPQISRWVCAYYPPVKKHLSGAPANYLRKIG